MSEEATQASTREQTRTVFQSDWQIYRKMVDNNYLFHREVYDRLHQLLLEDALPPFRFLDVACGDASASIRALTGTDIAQYDGIDLSDAALDLAEKALASLGCPVTLERRNFVEALRERSEPADVVWIGLSLHHLLAPAKLVSMREIRRIVGTTGIFVIYENASPDGEDRSGWLRRLDRKSEEWKEFTPEERSTMVAHAHAADFPETNSDWRRLGREAGFGDVRELFVSPGDLYRMYAFRA